MDEEYYTNQDIKNVFTQIIDNQVYVNWGIFEVPPKTKEFTYCAGNFIIGGPGVTLYT